ncbi:MAG TPA: hypothetical protein VIU87_16880 [Mycobacterium sp.]
MIGLIAICIRMLIAICIRTIRIRRGRWLHVPAHHAAGGCRTCCRKRTGLPELPPTFVLRNLGPPLQPVQDVHAVQQPTLGADEQLHLGEHLLGALPEPPFLLGGQPAGRHGAEAGEAVDRLALRFDRRRIVGFGHRVPPGALGHDPGR